VLCAINASEASLRLGIVGDIIVGLAGATAVVFLFGGTLKYSSDDKNSLVILVSVSLIAGIYGRNVVEAAGDKLLNKAKKQAEKTARDIVGPSAATIYALAAGNALDTNQPLEEAMKFAEKAIEIDRSNLSGYIEKGRVLKRLNRVEEALDLMEQTARNRRDPSVMYNLGCYRALLKKPLPSIRSALSEAFKLHPKLRDFAKKDHDLDSVRDMPEMKELGISCEPPKADIIDKQNPSA
jgi:tetratricopeptide (TPR) repeat protein